jgi:predicted nucleotidyltransferase
MNANEPAFLESVVAKLAAAYRPKAIYLFGSQARGTVQPDSDIDLLMVVEDSADRTRRNSHLAYRVLRPLGRAVDVLIWRHSRFIEESKSRTSLPGTVLREGVLLYAA